MRERAYISLGSNVDPARWLPVAAGRLSELGEVLAVSRVYQSPAYGSPDHPDFLNAAAIVITSFPPGDVRAELRRIESALGRVRGEDKFAPRTVDLDLCLYGNLVLDKPDLIVPHPDVIQRAYVAVPLAELDPGFRHPITGETLARIAARLRSGSELTMRADIALGGKVR